MVYLRQGQQGKALDYFRQAQQLDDDPDNVSKWQSLVEASSYWAYLDEGDALRQKGQLNQAARAYQKAMPVNAAEPYAYLKLAELYQQQQNLLMLNRLTGKLCSVIPVMRRSYAAW